MTVETTWRDGIAILKMDNPPVNALGRALRKGLVTALAEALERGARAIVITAAGRTFSAGADIKEFDAPLLEPLLPEVLAKVEASPVPVIAFIQGAALGGGCELALACHGRLATKAARFALPEVRLGLLPGAGGTQRLPRLIGLAPALDIILTGRTFEAVEAERLGVVDRLVPEAIVDDAIAFAESLVASTPSRTSSRPMPVSEAVDFQKVRQSLKPGASGLFAQRRIVEALEMAATLPFQEGMKRERALFMECRASAESAALRYQFFAERHTGAPDAGEARPIESVGVVGAGTMGRGIAIACASAGLPVFLFDSVAAARDGAVERIRTHFTDASARGKFSPAKAEAATGLVRVAQRIEDLAGCDLIIEAVLEDRDVKAKVFQALDVACAPHALLATNTSTLDIDAIAAATSRPSQVLGLHFFSPADVMRLLEIVRGAATSSAALAAAHAFAKKLGKVSVVAGNCFGFIGNRMLQGYYREALTLVLEGNSPERVDAALRAFGFPMGPLAVRDLAGIDIGLAIRAERERRGELPADPRPFVLLERLAALGRLGQKTGAGLYAYPDGTRRGVPDPLVAEIAREEARRLGIDQREASEDEIRDRCLLPLVLEGVRLLDESIAARASDVDVVWVNGYGFPRWRGGPLRWADQLGLSEVVARADALVRSRGRDFGYWDVPASLRERAGSGGSLTPVVQ
jgi:3-hydroxyacyl-CoA dehydrogenase